MPDNQSKLGLWWDGLTTAGTTEMINMLAVIAFFLIWLIAAIAFAIGCGSVDCFWQVFSKIIAVSAAGYFSGGIMGFIFGIPKTLQNPDRASKDTANQPQSNIQSLFFTNTSLEQISDWLTKIIVGVGLVKLTKIPGYLGNLRTQLKGMFPGDSASAYALSLIIFSCIVGFITFYIYTRVNLAAQFIKEAFDNNQLTNDIVKKAASDSTFKTNLIDKLNPPNNNPPDNQQPL